MNCVESRFRGGCEMIAHNVMCVVCASVLLLCGSGLAFGADYPKRPVRMGCSLSPCR